MRPRSLKKNATRLLIFCLICSLTLSIAAQGKAEAEDQTSPPVGSGYPVLSYGIIELGTLGGNGAFARDINDRGQITGNANVPNGTLHAYLWENGVMRDLGFLSNGVEFSRGFAINEQGVVTGESDNDSSKAFYYDPAIGEMRSLQSIITSNPDGLNIAGGFGAGINDGFQIVGTMTRTVIRAFKFDNGEVRDLGSIDGMISTTARAWGINNFGQTVGLSRNANGVSHATLWFNGTATDLGSLGGETALSEAFRINDRGQVVGRSVAVAGQTPQHAFLWQNGQMTSIGRAPDVNFARANDINNFGTIVGTVSQFEGFSGRAVVWRPGDTTPTELNSLLPNNSGWTLLTSAEGINNFGQIVGFGTKNGFTRAFVMTPYDVSLTDADTGTAIFINSRSGDYQVIDCSGNIVIRGRGTVSVSGCDLRLRHSAFIRGRRTVDVVFNLCRLVGNAFYRSGHLVRPTFLTDNEQGNASIGGGCK